MFKIEIQDLTDPVTLRAFATLFSTLAGDKTGVITRTETATAGNLGHAVTVTTPASHAVIDPLDNPSNGRDVGEDPYLTGITEKTAPVDLSKAGFGQGVTLPNGASGAPFTAGAVPLQTAPVAMAVPTSTLLPMPGTLLPAPGAALLAPPVALPSANPVQVDSRGLPWDARIHASTKAKVADGSWKTKRGVEAGLVTQVENELRQVMAIPVATGAALPNTLSAPGLPPTGTPFASSPTLALPGSVALLPDPTQAVSHAAPLATLPSGQPGAAIQSTGAPLPMAFNELVGKITAAKAAGTVTDAMLAQVATNLGLPNFPILAVRPDFVRPFHDALFGAA